MADNRPIGIFDSGCGGVTALRELQRLLPQEQFLYLGDTARMPYGSHTPEELSLYAHQITGFLLRQGVKAIVAACGTVSANVPGLRRELPVPFFDVISASAKAAAAATHSGRVGLCATEATIRSGRFAAALEALPGISVTAVACPRLVPMIEGGTPADSPELLDAVREYCKPMLAAGVDTLVLGCTHYPLIAPAFAAALGKKVALVDCGAAAAAQAAETLRSSGLLAQQEAAAPRFWFTARPEQAAALAGLALGQDISAQTRLLPPDELAGGAR